MSSRELLYLEDALSHEAFLKTQCQQAIDNLTDPELKNRAPDAEQASGSCSASSII